MELIFFSYRELTTETDKVLDNIKFGKIHHKIIYFVGRQKNIKIKELLKILQISKQSFSRVLNQLVKHEYLMVSRGYDKRSKNLSLTTKGSTLENNLSLLQINKIRNILRNADENDINSFKKILYAMIDDKSKKILNELK